MAITLSHSDAEIHISELQNGKRHISVHPSNKSGITPFGSWETSYPVELIRQILEVKGPNHLCDEIMRDEDPSYVQMALEDSILGYVDECAFANKTILDFGCGCGSSTMVLARLFPDARIIGLDMLDEFISVARARADHYSFSSITFWVSSTREIIPEGSERFDFAVLSAVYEHLLPEERQVVMPTIWSFLNPGGIVFINQTPSRWFLVENHTTNLPLINYLPDYLTYVISRMICKRIRRHESWKALLRRGIRGATPGEIIRIVEKNCHEKPVLLQPCRRGYRDRIDLWYALSSDSRLRTVKQLLKTVFKMTKYATGLVFLPSLNLAIKKPDDA